MSAALVNLRARVVLMRDQIQYRDSTWFGTHVKFANGTSVPRATFISNILAKIDAMTASEAVKVPTDSGLLNNLFK